MARPKHSLNTGRPRPLALPGSLTAVAALAAAALAASALSAGPAWAGEGAEVIGVRWSIVDAVVSAGSEADGRDGMVVVVGETDRPGEPILVTARAPDGTILHRGVVEAPAQGGSFLAEVPAAGPGWSGSGLYTATLYQGAPGGVGAPYVDIVPIVMSGGLVQANAELSGAEVPGAAAGYAEPLVNNLAWSMIEEVSVAAGGGAAGGDAVRLSGTAPGGLGAVHVRVVAPTGLEVHSEAASATGPSGAFDVVLETDGSRWAQDGTYRITVGADRPSPAGAGSPPDLLLADIFDGSLAVPASASAAAADPRGEDGDGRQGAPSALLYERWEVIDAVAVSGQGGLGQLVVVAGSTDVPGVPVSVRVSDPHGRAVHDSSVMPGGPRGEFLVEIPASGEAWSIDGAYEAAVGQMDGGTGQVHYADLLVLDVAGGAVAGQPRLAGAALPPAIAGAYAGPLPVALEYAVVKEVRAEEPREPAPRDGGPGLYAKIVVSGRTFDRSGPLSIAVEAPDGSSAPPMRVDPWEDGRFEAHIPVSGPFWSADGEYAVTVTRAGGDSPFTDVAVVSVRGGAVEAGRQPAAPAPAPAAYDSPRIMNIGERWNIIDAVVLAEDDDAGQAIVVLGTTDIADRAVQATVTAPDGARTVAVHEAAPDPSGAVLLEVPVGGAAWADDGCRPVFESCVGLDGAGWGDPRPEDGTYTLTVGQPGTRYLDGYPVSIVGGRVVVPAEFGGAPVPLPAGSYDSASLLDMAWTLVTRADVETSADGSPEAVVIAGSTGHPKVPIEVRAEAPDGSVILDSRIASRADGSFEARIVATGSGWDDDGSYRITLRQGFESAPPDLVIVEVVDGAVVPEFGAVAAAVLAAAVAAAAVAAAAASPRLGLGLPRP